MSMQPKLVSEAISSAWARPPIGGTPPATTRAGVMKTRSVAHGRAFTLLVLSALALLNSGCATPALWKHTAAREWHPSSSPARFLATTTADRQDVIVVFRQSAEVGKKTKYRLVAWNLRCPPSELTIGRSALRQLTNACDRVQLIPVFTSDTIPSNVTSTGPGYAVQDQPYHFILRRDGVPSGSFELPVSHEKYRSGERIALAPLAIATDTAIVGAVLLVYVAAGVSAGMGGG